jgi:hypothetical protein
MSDRAVIRRPISQLVTELWRGTADVDPGILQWELILVVDRANGESHRPEADSRPEALWSLTIAARRTYPATSSLEGHLSKPSDGSSRPRLVLARRAPARRSGTVRVVNRCT